jgi:LysM repeat protein
MKHHRPPVAPPPAQKVQATTRRASRAAHDNHDEPNMKLSHAFIVVLVLHVVAVGGIYAFNSIKAQRERAAEMEPPQMAKNYTAAPVAEEAKKTVVAQKAGAPVEQPKSVEKAVEKTAAKPVEKPTPAAKTPAKQEKPPKDSGKVYTVVKGDNPVSIAKKLNVNYDALLRLNDIDDPRRLQIGQKLHIPAKSNGG